MILIGQQWESQAILRVELALRTRRVGAEDVLEIVEKYYPQNRIQPKTRFAIEELCQEDDLS